MRVEQHTNVHVRLYFYCPYGSQNLSTFDMFCFGVQMIVIVYKMVIMSFVVLMMLNFCNYLYLNV